MPDRARNMVQNLNKAKIYHCSEYLRVVKYHSPKYAMVLNTLGLHWLLNVREYLWVVL